MPSCGQGEHRQELGITKFLICVIQGRSERAAATFKSNIRLRKQ